MIRVESPERQDEQDPPSQILVRSSIAFPLANSIPANRVNPQPRQGEPTYLVKISWHGGGQQVYLTRAGDDDWNGKTEMSREDSTFSTIIALPRGTHHLRFIVDGETRVADDLPTAVADNGSLANYVAVGLGEGDSPTTDEAQRPDTLTRFHSAFWSEEGPLLSNEVWSTEIPLELVEAALEEESYLAYQNDLENAQATGQRIHIAGFVPLPNIPPAPRLPRYLDKLILNSPPLTSNGSPSTSVTGSPKSRTASPVPVVGIGALGERSGRERTSPLRREGRDERTSREGRKREREWKSMSLVIAQRSTDRPLPITTASGTDVSQSPPPSSIPHSPEPSYYGTYNSANALAIQNPQINSVDTANAIPALADDTSVLPVPSHVVLHHLCTSAMRNGVLAVGETTRYRKKFVTTIYYKPTS
ncbi:5'-AMP-activated protein kinase beta subunit, interation domain-containing protein [Lentinula detonsa]|uniref:5'-AMP-activated protein kinase beta subunit, interation domain-containing protein n=1 Tax=Lentinula detonsa TaxID=2804962 RepID=A0AA38Q5R8_9AGAR|nr:5'-AMP-activated protein kinase beta subunit, interation domain-containing protein [Lentinula detonsa]